VVEAKRQAVEAIEAQERRRGEHQRQQAGVAPFAAQRG
jgi:hypothetical protein